MTDPFDVLRITDAPLEPRPDFAGDLRRTFATALETMMTDTATTPAATQVQTQTITAYISVRNAAAALAFYVEAFGAVELTRFVSDDGRIGHAEIAIGTSTLMLADEYPEIDSVGPETRGGPTASFTIEVPDADASFARAIAAGAVIERPVDDQFHGNRMGSVRDPFGHRWTLSTPVAGFDHAEYARLAEQEGYELIEAKQLKQHDDGDLYYFSLQVRDLAKARAFFGAVLGWQYPDSQQDERGAHVANISAPPGSIAQIEPGGSTSARLWFAIDDIHAAVAKVRELGGSADEPVLFDSGWSADCIDDQGTTFSLSVPAAKYTL